MRERESFYNVFYKFILLFYFYFFCFIFMFCSIFIFMFYFYCFFNLNFITFLIFFWPQRPTLRACGKGLHKEQIPGSGDHWGPSCRVVTILKSCGVSHLTLGFLFQDSFATLDPAHFHMNFKISLMISKKDLSRIFTRVAVSVKSIWEVLTFYQF